MDLEAVSEVDMFVSNDIAEAAEAVTNNLLPEKSNIIWKGIHEVLQLEKSEEGQRRYYIEGKKKDIGRYVGELGACCNRGKL